MGNGRNVFDEPVNRGVIRTADVYQTESEVGTTGYSDTLLSLVARFSNSGIPEGHNAQCMVGKSKRGEVAAQFFAVIDPFEERFIKVGFKSRGCLAMTACASMACMLLEGKTFDEALKITHEDIKEELDGVPWDRIHAAYFAVEGIRALVGDYYLRQGAGLKELTEQNICDEQALGCIMTEHCSLRDSRTELRLREYGKQ